MNDLINGREMLKRYQEDLCYGIACKECSMCTEDGGCRVEEWIDNLPSADRPQGEWIGQADGYADGEFVYDTWFCSNCDYEVDDDEPPTWNYCPNCGARMKGAE